MAPTICCRCVLGAGFFGAFIAGALAARPADPPADAPALRRPVALALADAGRWLFIANQRTGTVTAVDTASRRSAGEVKVGRRLADLAILPDGRLAVVDEEAGELILLDRQQAALRVTHRLPLEPAPVSIQVTADGGRCFVASLWSRRVTVVELPAAGPHVARVAALPFAPRKLLLVRGDSKLIVADSFGGRLAVLDARSGAVESVRALPGHNIRGLALAADGETLLVAHQVLNPLAHTTRDDIHWGNLLTNNLRSLPLADVLTAGADLVAVSHLEQLGDVHRGAADPAAVAVGAGGRLLIALAGVGEVAVGRPGAWERLAVGRRPTAAVVAPDGRRAYVANTHADSVSIVDLVSGKVEAEIALGTPAKPNPADRGELLFHDARLSHDGWLSCQSCHTDGHTNGLLNDNLSDGSFGTPKRVLSLLGVKDTGPWAWNGSMPDLESQVGKSVVNTMRGRPLAEAQVRELTAYLRTLAPPPASWRPATATDQAALGRGRAQFEKLGCASCHSPPEYTSRKTYDVGLADEAGNRLFNPPSLRGVGQGGPYFHDGRAARLEEVFTRHRHQLKDELSREQLADLLGFLRSL